MAITFNLYRNANRSNQLNGSYPNGDAPALPSSVLIEDWAEGLFEIMPGDPLITNVNIMSGIGGASFGDVTFGVVDEQGVRSTDTKVFKHTMDTVYYGSGDENLSRVWWRPKSANMNGLHYAHEYTRAARANGDEQTANSWIFNHFNRMRVWLKIPNVFSDAGTRPGNFDMGTYVREYATGNYDDQEAGNGWHYYHKAAILPTGVNGWVQIIINLTATTTRSDYYIEGGDWPNVEYITVEGPNYNYFDTLTNFYMDTGLKSIHTGLNAPIDIRFGMMEFYREEDVYNTKNISTPWGGFSNDTITVGWIGNLKELDTPNEYVRYSFSNIKENGGWSSATAIAGNEEVAPNSAGYEDFRWTQVAKVSGATGSELDISGRDVIYIAIADSPTAGDGTQYEQIMIPLTQAGQDIVANYYQNKGAM